MLQFVRSVTASARLAATAQSVRPALSSLLPSKRTINRILFDHDSNITYGKMIPLLTHIYDNLATPSKIEIPKNIRGSDLMVFRKLLATIRTQTQSINSHLFALENEIVEQSAEMGDLDAITILAFEKIRQYLKRETVVSPADKEDYQTAQKLIEELTDLKHPLVFKLAGDLALERSMWDQAHSYYTQFLKVENDTIEAGHVCYQLGYYHYANPQQSIRDYNQAKSWFLKCIELTDLDLYSVKAHYYVGQIYLNELTTTPKSESESKSESELIKRAKYHWEISASKGLIESFSSLGFLEMNKLNNCILAIEWFKLGLESDRTDCLCLVGQFDCYFKMKEWPRARKIWMNLNDLREKIESVKKKSGGGGGSSNDIVPENMRESFNRNDALLNSFFSGRENEFKELEERGYGL
ncbi:hypothetical protein KGF56_003015 [Candida oxycetoniae]|uniref:Protein MSS2, mitochondrial n=1 Tax=Candida oxycetoniae TaxID=497107 RepID=A0AAI9SX11_9ASCO|nr:uncharacterized protein KGF56_003015 [Candida oxycetoniae]KAI3404115.2 hypothetical protein KGF56_003015 [Candida oxycetoniae]